jgi:glycosyltransferase involved in cell wall biosynthesis
VYPRASAIVATSEGVKRDLTGAFGVPEERVAVVHNPVDLRLIARRADEPVDAVGRRRPGRPLIVAAGRLAEAKNYPLLIEGLALLRDAHVDVDAWILGAGDQEPRIRAAIVAARLEDRIHLLGFQENPWKFVGRADVFVLTSRYEGFGNVLIEAMACGVPVVATESPGTREIVRSEDNGLLVSDHHAPALATALRRLLDDRALAFRLRTRASETVRAYSADTVARQYAALFFRVAGWSVATSYA